MKCINVFNLTQEPLPELVFGSDHIKVMAPAITPRFTNLPLSLLREEVRYLMYQIKETPKFSVRNDTYIILDGSDNSWIATSTIQLWFILFQNYPKVWLAKKNRPLEFIDTWTLYSDSIDLYQTAQLEEHEQARIDYKSGA